MKLSHRILRRLFPEFYRAAVAQGDGGLVWFPVTEHTLPSDALDWVLVVATELVPDVRINTESTLVTHIRRARPGTLRAAVHRTRTSPLDGAVYHAWAVVPEIPTHIKELANGKQE